MKNTRAQTFFKKGLFLFGFFLWAPFLFAETAASTINPADTAWMMISTALVLIMTPGLAFFYAGMVRSKNAGSTTFQAFVTLGIITLTWAFVGYSLAFGTDTMDGLIGDWRAFFCLNAVDNGPSSFSAVIPHSVFMLFQCMFAVITPALIIGAFAERIKFKACVYFLILWSLLVYCPVAHWVWGGGFIFKWGAIDFAGGMVVHMTAGCSALVAALVLGKRCDYYKAAGAEKAEYRAHNTPLVCIGTALLWFGWFGFNAGSALASNASAANAFVTTHLATATALVVWMILDWASSGKPNLVGACIGSVVGLIAITPAAGFVDFKHAIYIGAIASAISYISAKAIRAMAVDDSLDVFACHGIAGFVGAVLTGAFANEAVGGKVGGLSLALIQAKSAGVVFLYCIVATYFLLKLLDIFVGLRPTEQDELLGLDKSEHNEPSYF